MSLIPMDPTHIDHHASNHSPLHPLRVSTTSFKRRLKMSYNLITPEHSSSNRAFADMEADKNKRVVLDIDIKRESEMIKEADSFDSKYWTKLSQVSDLKAKRSGLSLRLLQDELTDDRASDKNDEERRLREENHSHSLEAKIFRKQALRVGVKPGDEEKNRRGYFMQQWTTSAQGLRMLGIETGEGKQTPHVQEQFREKLIAACKSRDPNPKSHDLWCPILGYYFPGDKKTMYAAHIFPWAQSQVSMNEIFGKEVENVESLDEISNGLMLSSYASRRLEDGDIILVPDVADTASQDGIDTWSESEPKEYKIRVLNPEARGMDWIHPGYVNPRQTWNDLDGKKVQFSSDHRPHARYLYWQYCKTMLRRSWEGKGVGSWDVPMWGLGKSSWGPKGPYIKKRMLLAFVEQLGHDAEALMENAIVESEEDDVPGSDPSALLLASAEIRKSHRKYSGEGDEESEESDDD